MTHILKRAAAHLCSRVVLTPFRYLPRVGPMRDIKYVRRGAFTHRWNRGPTPQHSAKMISTFMLEQEQEGPPEGSTVARSPHQCHVEAACLARS